MGVGHLSEFEDAHITAEGNAALRPTTVRLLARRFHRLGALVACCVLIPLTWLGTTNAIRTHRAEALARVEADVGNEALVFEELLRRQLLSADQTLNILELEWERDPTHFDLADWGPRVVVLTDVTLQVFVADQTGIVRSSTRPEIVGNDISGRDYFRHEAALRADDGRMFIGSLTQGLTTRLWQFNLARRLDYPGGRFGGVIAASFGTTALNSFYGRARVGPGDIIAVVGVADGVVRASAGTGAPAPAVSIAGTQLFAAMQSAPDQPWIGPSAPDGIQRIHAFGTVPDRNLMVMVGFDRDRAMASSDVWARGALAFASGVTVLVLVMTVLLLRAERDARRREQELANDRAVLAAKNAELLAAQQHAQAKAAQLSATLTGMNDGVMMVDADWNLLEWNDRFPGYTGVPAAVLHPGFPMREIIRVQAEAGEFGPVDVEAEADRRMQLLHSGSSMGTVVRVRPNGRILELRRNPLAGGGFVTLYADITDRRQAEDRLRQAQTLAAIGRLTAGVAHDFNNLLASIIGNTELLDAASRNDARSARCLSLIMQAATRGATLVRQLLAFSRKQALMPARLDLNAALGGMAELLRSTLGPEVTLEWDLEPNLWPALADAVQIEHVILNLAINARDAMPGGGRLLVSTANLSAQPPDCPSDLAPGEYVVAGVTDSGTGMSDEVLRNAFEPFFTTKEPGKGSGLGLSQVHGVAHQSGGGVQITSDLGKGTTVKVFLPRATGPATIAPAEDLRRPLRDLATEAPLAGMGRTILVVDDDVSVRETIAAILSIGGFTIVDADSGREALRLFDRGLEPDLVVVDFLMRDMDGLEVAQAVRRLQPDLPIVFVTGYGEEEVLNGERWVLIKPFLADALIKMLQEALDQAHRVPNASGVL